MERISSNGKLIKRIAKIKSWVIGHSMTIARPIPSQINGSFAPLKNPLIRRTTANKK